MKPELTIFSAEEYKKHFIETSIQCYNYYGYTSDFWSLVTGNDSFFTKRKYMTSTRDVNGFNKIGILAVDYCSHDVPTIFMSLKETDKIAVKPVIKNLDELSYTLKCKNGSWGKFLYGVFPFEMLCNKNNPSITNEEIENEYKNNKLIKTGKEYTIGFKKYEEYVLETPEVWKNENNYFPNEKDLYNKYFSEKKDIDVNVKYLARKKYIRFVDKSSSRILWVEVEPIEWVTVEVNEGKHSPYTEYAVARCNVFSGVPLTLTNSYYGNFENTYLYEYLNNNFATEILPIKDYFIEKSIEKLDMKKKLKKIFLKLIEEDDIYNLDDKLPNIMLYYIKDKYNDLKESDYAKLEYAVLKYILLTKDNYFYQEVIREKRKKLQKEERDKFEEQLENLKIQSRLNNMSFDEIVDHVLKYVTSDMSVDEIIEAIYTLYPYLKNDELPYILHKVRELKK